MHFRDTLGKRYEGHLWEGLVHQPVIHPGYKDGDLVEAPMVDNVFITGITIYDISFTLRSILLDLMMQYSPKDFAYAFFNGASGGIKFYVGHYSNKPDNPHLLLEDTCDSTAQVMSSLKNVIKYAIKNPNKFIVVVFSDYASIPLSRAEWKQIYNEFSKYSIHVIITSHHASALDMDKFLRVYPCTLRMAENVDYDPNIIAALGVLPVQQLPSSTSVYMNDVASETLVIVEIPGIDSLYEAVCWEKFTQEANGYSNYINKLDQEGIT